MHREYEYTIMLRYTLTLFLLLAPAVDAALYKWVDEEGVTHFTKTLPPEAAVRGSEVITEQGRVLKKTQGARTAEEKLEDARLEAEQERKARMVKAAKKRDKILRGSYHTVADIEAKREQELHALNNQIKTLEKKFRGSKKEYSGLTTKAVQKERAGNMPSEKLKGEIRSAKRELDDYKANLSATREDHIRISQSFADDIKRFKELKEIE